MIVLLAEAKSLISVRSEKAAFRANGSPEAGRSRPPAAPQDAAAPLWPLPGGRRKGATLHGMVVLISSA